MTEPTLDIPEAMAALSLPARLRLIQVLASHKETLATSLLAQLAGDMTDHVCSKHLHILGRAGLVLRTPSGRYALWTLNREAFVSLAQVLLEIGKEPNHVQETPQTSECKALEAPLGEAEGSIV